MSPKSALNDLTSIERAGVGIGPTRITSTPTDINPDVMAGSTR